MDVVSISRRPNGMILAAYRDGRHGRTTITCDALYAEGIDLWPVAIRIRSFLDLCMICQTSSYKKNLFSTSWAWCSWGFLLLSELISMAQPTVCFSLAFQWVVVVLLRCLPEDRYRQQNASCKAVVLRLTLTTVIFQHLLHLLLNYLQIGQSLSCPSRLHYLFQEYIM